MTGTTAIDLARTLESGQFFRWRRRDDGFLIVTHGRAFVADDDLRVRGATRAFADRFFGPDLTEIHQTLERDPLLRPFLVEGLRILRQDPWECLVSFVTSCASNIPRIARNLDSLCASLGEPLPFDARAMPHPRALRDEKLLRRLGFGFRARHLVPLAREVERGALDGLDRLSTDEARVRLVSLPGVGVKVADCVLLFAYARFEAFPIDVHVRRAMTGLCFGGRPAGDRRIREEAARRWGAHAGVAQQHLYVRARSG
ncbi:MAG: hypothetical protein HYY17_08620 [Planctomycetes bacterium]|nr:hypothetical protein [Planctomycetota bacterium]